MRIPKCCRATMEGPLSEYPQASPDCVASLPKQILELSAYAKVAPDQVYVCKTCSKIYDAAVFDAIEEHLYKIDSIDGKWTRFR